MAVRPRFLFHIGSHKTGTTYLQAVFRALAPAFAERGVHVPEQWYRGARLGGHHRLPLQLQRNDTEALHREMEEVLRTDRPDVLISAEGLSLLNIRQVEALRQVLDGAEARFVFHCRRWSDFLPSHWQTMIRGGHDDPWPQFFRQTIAAPEESTALNFTPRLDAYARVFGPERVSIVSYSNVVDAGRNLATDFLETFLPHAAPAFDPDNPAVKGQNNVSLPVWQTEIVRIMNSMLRRNGHPAGSAPRAWLMQQRAKLSLGELEQALMANLQSITVSDSAPKLLALHARLFHQWGARLVNAEQPNRLFDPRTRDVSFIHPRAMRNSDTAWLMHEVFDQFRRDTGVSIRRAQPNPAGSAATSMIAS